MLSILLNSPLNRVIFQEDSGKEKQAVIRGRETSVSSASHHIVFCPRPSRPDSRHPRHTPSAVGYNDPSGTGNWTPRTCDERLETETGRREREGREGYSGYSLKSSLAQVTGSLCRSFSVITYFEMQTCGTKAHKHVFSIT